MLVLQGDLTGFQEGSVNVLMMSPVLSALRHPALPLPSQSPMLSEQQLCKEMVSITPDTSPQPHLSSQRREPPARRVWESMEGPGSAWPAKDLGNQCSANWLRWTHFKQEIHFRCVKQRGLRAHCWQHGLWLRVASEGWRAHACVGAWDPQRCPNNNVNACGSVGLFPFLGGALLNGRAWKPAGTVRSQWMYPFIKSQVGEAGPGAALSFPANHAVGTKANPKLFPKRAGFWTKHYYACSRSLPLRRSSNPKISGN